MRAGRKYGMTRLARWILIPLAGVAVLSSLAGPAGASSDPQLRVGTLDHVVSIASDSPNGGFCALLSTGRVDCWGYNGDGELGNGNATDSDVPVAVTGITDAKAVASSSDGTSFCALLSAGPVKCWGNNAFGELGNGTTTTFDVPVSVKNISTATAVVGGIDGFCALLSTKHIDCWGAGGSGQLGNGTTTSSDVPVAVTGITDAKAVVSGSQYGDYCALLSTGKVRCWGYNGDGELGNGTMTDSDVPVTVIGITDATAVASTLGGRSHCALLSTGKLKCWGLDFYGELGDGTATTSDVPVSVKNVSTATAVIGGYFRFCARLSTGHLDCWGLNDYGELGNGTTTNSDVPVAVHKITDAPTLIGSFNDFCALLSTSGVDCWGYGGDGELGNGTFNNSDVPVAVHAAS
jgi:alpha-tubulin suppressor-like RCC1 family protein